MMPVIQHYSMTPAPVAPTQEEQSAPHSSSGAYTSNLYPSAVKLLVSNNVAGSIIGRSGQTISSLQSQSSARIKLSQTGDFYPGTQDRVCLVQGQPENVKLAVRLLLERFHMLQAQQYSQQVLGQHAKSNSFDFVVRILVPNSSCGMIIGKAGSNIKQMQEISGVSSVRLSPKENPDSPSATSAAIAATSERIVTLTGPTFDSCLICLHAILDGMLANQETCRYANLTTSYTRIVMQGSFAVMPNSGHLPENDLMIASDPLLNEPQATFDAVPSQYATQFGQGKRSNSSPDLGGTVWDPHEDPLRAPTENIPAASMPNPLPPRPTEHSLAYSSMMADNPASFPSEMSQAMSSSAGVPISNANTPIYMIPQPHPSHVDSGTIPNSLSAPDLLAARFQESLRLDHSPSPVPMEYSHFAPQLPQPVPPGFSARIFVPDSLVGSILGRGGRTLNELQMHSNTAIQISQRGEFVPGTRNRIVSIRGPTAQSVNLAQYLMNQRMVLPPTAYSGQPPFVTAPPSQMGQGPTQHQYPLSQRDHAVQVRSDSNPGHITDRTSDSVSGKGSALSQQRQAQDGTLPTN